MDAKIVTGRQLPITAVGAMKRGANYKANSVEELLGYRDDYVKGKGEACGLPLTHPRDQVAKGVRVRVGNTFRGKRMKCEPFDLFIVSAWERIEAEVVK